MPHRSKLLVRCSAQSGGGRRSAAGLGRAEGAGLMSALAVSESSLGVAVIGMSGRFPGARDVAEFWTNLANGVESIRFFSDEELLQAGVHPELLKLPNYVKAGGVLADIDLFDASFFGFSARDAEILDPQHRLFLECAWQALEDAGYNPDTYRGLIGVYAGAAISTYLFNLYSNLSFLQSADPFQLLLGNDKDHLTTQASYKLNLRGPSIVVQTACSTSLVSIVMACQSLLNYECDMALAGGVAVNLSCGKGYLYQRGGISSPDGHCRTFDASAQGTVSGCGIGLVVLKRLQEALADGDRILAILKGAALNNDGSLKAGYTAPSIEGQSQVIAMAHAMAGVGPDTISYVEAHGTGTPLGDPIEVAALNQVFRAGTTKTRFCGIGSVKTNIGHLDTAAGVAGFIKTVLALAHRQIPPSLHFVQPNPAIDFATSPFYVNTRLVDWTSSGEPRRAGVSSFGMGGTNAHVVLEEAPPPAMSGPSRSVQLVVLSAKKSAALETLTDSLALHLRQNPELSIADVAFTLQVGRKPLARRRMLLLPAGASSEEAAGFLETRDPGRVFTSAGEPRNRSVVFMFPGQGAQHADMTRHAYDDEPTFRADVDRCSELLLPHLGMDLRDAIYGPPPPSDTIAPLDRTELTQPALFVVEYALSRLWMQWGISPHAMIGHSVGEYVAACLSGVLSLEAALALVAIRGRLMANMPAGAMTAVPLSEHEMGTFLEPGISIAAVNGPTSCVISGAFDAVARAEARLQSAGIQTRRLRTSHAFHSAMMDPVLEPYRDHLRGVRLQSPQIPYVSNLTGDWIAASDAVNPEYWVRHLRDAVRFGDGIERLVSDPDWILLEVGPGQTLTSMARQQTKRSSEQLVLPSLRRPGVNENDMAVLLKTLGQLWMSGVAIDWTGFYAHERRRRVQLPGYPFERQRYWIDPETSVQPAVAEGVAVRRRPLEEWFYAPSWKRAVAAPMCPSIHSEPTRRWLVFADSCGLGNSLIERLKRNGDSVHVVQAGTVFSEQDGSSSIDSERPEDYAALFDSLSGRGALPTHILHLWSVDPAVEVPDDDGVKRSISRGFYSVLHLTRALSDRPATGRVTLAVVTTDVDAVIPDDDVVPAKAPVLGLCKVISQEHPHIVCRCIDVKVSASGREYEATAEQLITEVTALPFEPVVAYRGNQRWVQVFEPVRLESTGAASVALRPHGVYLITGGLGNIGLALAEQLAVRTQARLVLVSRSEFPERENWDDWLSTHNDRDRVSRRILRLRSIESAGGQTLIIRGDISSPEDMARIIAEARRQLGPINGVIHGAGQTGEDAFCLVTEATRARCELQFLPKLRGLLNLSRALDGTEIDFWLCLSSLSAVLGGLGFGAYAGANCFMDAFAARQQSLGRGRWISVNWDGWYFPEDGRPVPTEHLEGLPLIDADHGTEAAFRILDQCGEPGILVSPTSLEIRLAQWVRLESLREPAQGEAAESGTRHARPSITTPFVAPRDPEEETIARVWQQLLGLDQVGVHDNFFELGGHSLLAIQLVSRLYDAFGVELSVDRIFEAATVAEQAQVLTSYKETTPHDESKVLELLEFVEGLSDEQVRDLLGREGMPSSS
jgi:acyl transferase domain-containing protein